MALNREIIERLFELYGIDRNSINDVNEYGELYECTKQGRPYILRVTDYKTFKEQRAEASFINFLHANGVSVANVIPSQEGNLVEVIDKGERDITAVLFTKAAGHHATSEEWNSDLIEKLGQVIGKMHRLSKGNKDTYGLIHGDVCQGNFFLNDDKITLIDFQDCEHNYFIFDLAAVIYFAVENSFNGNDINSYSIEFIKALLKGYRKECNIDSFWIEKIPLFLKLREMLSFIILHCYWDVESFDEDRKALLNLYRKNIEYDIPVLNIDFKQFC